MTSATPQNFDVEIEKTGPLRLGEPADSLGCAFEEVPFRLINLGQGGLKGIVLENNAVSRSQITEPLGVLPDSHFATAPDILNDCCRLAEGGNVDWGAAFRRHLVGCQTL
jgi:hypothetical protein